ncbi:hypothetical protein LR48_Vigan04g155200, partial [Vigna angularis]
LFQRDTTGLSSENTELNLRLQAMKQQAKLCDANVLLFMTNVHDFNPLPPKIVKCTALNEALKKEVDRLRIATGEIAMPADNYGLGMHQLTYSQGPFFSHHSPHGQNAFQATQMPHMHSLSSNVATSNLI